VLTVGLAQVCGHQRGGERKDPDRQQQQVVQQQGRVVGLAQPADIAWWLIQMIPMVTNEVT
jgi:hypothetical protein